MCEPKEKLTGCVPDDLPECFGMYGEICDDVACEICEYAAECEEAAEGGVE